MISLNLNIRNPWSDRFENIKSWTGEFLAPFKYWEIQIYKSADIISASVYITGNRPHAGLQLGLSLLGYTVEFTIYDVRH